SMEMSINVLVERVDEFLYERGTLLYRFQAGLTHTLPVSTLHRDFPELSRVESFLRVREMLSSPRTDGTRKTGLKLLLHFLGDTLEERRSAEAHERLAALLASAPVPGVDGGLPLSEGLARLPVEPSRDRRALLERETGRLLWENQAAWARGVDEATAL